MKELKLYQCEVCGAQYKTSEMAEECEKFHRVPRGVKTDKYMSMNGEYPDYIFVTFDDGSEKRYALVHS